MRNYYLTKVNNKKADIKLDNITSIASKISPFADTIQYQAKVLKQALNLKAKNNDDIVNNYIMLKNKPLEIGSKVHDIISTKMQKDGTVIHKDNDKTIINCLNAYNDFITENKVKVLYNEVPIFNNKYAGTYDFLLKIKKDVVLCDIKTTEIIDNQFYYSVSYLLQIAMYIDCIRYIVTAKKKQYSIMRKTNSIEEPFNIIVDNKRLEYYKMLVDSPKAILVYLDKLEGKYYIKHFDRQQIDNAIKQVDLFLDYEAKNKELKKLVGYSKYISY